MNRVGMALLVTHLACLILSEFAHAHHHVKALPATHAVTAHSCGEVEIHRPLDWISHCTLCRDGHGRFFMAVHEPAGHGGLVTCEACCFITDSHPRLTSFSIQDPARAPPLV